MTIGTRQCLIKVDNINIYIDNQIVKEVQNQKLLGVNIDKTLNWDKQIDDVCLNITRRITLLKLLSKYLEIAHLKQYYNSYVLPIFDYGCMIWGRCKQANINRLLKLQKRAARIVLQADFLTPSKAMFNSLNWLSFPQRIQYHTCIMMYKALNGLTPEYIADLFTRTSEAHNRSLRSADNDMLRIPMSKTSYFDRSFAVIGAKQWNDIPLHIRQSSSLNSFRTSLKLYLLNN